jgi:hypothetical protein
LAVLRDRGRPCAEHPRVCQRLYFRVLPRRSRLPRADSRLSSSVDHSHIWCAIVEAKRVSAEAIILLAKLVVGRAIAPSETRAPVALSGTADADSAARLSANSHHRLSLVSRSSGSSRSAPGASWRRLRRRESRSNGRPTEGTAAAHDESWLVRYEAIVAIARIVNAGGARMLTMSSAQHRGWRSIRHRS